LELKNQTRDPAFIRGASSSRSEFGFFPAPSQPPSFAPLRNVWPTMQLLDLNHDILSFISNSVERKDLGSWRRTCKSLAAAAAPSFFQDLSLHWPSHVAGVSERLASKPEYAHYIRAIRILLGCYRGDNDGEDAEEQNQSTSVFLANLLERASGLRTLKMENAEFWLRYDAVLDSLGAHKTLVHMDLGQCGLVEGEGLYTATVRLFSRLRAPLRTLRLDKISSDETFPVHLLSLLEHAAPTLEELDMDVMHIDTWKHRVALPIFPRLHSLRIKSEDAHVPTIQAAFPLVRYLDIDLWGFHDYPYDYSEEAPVFRPWRRLDVLKGTVQGLKRLRLTGTEAILLDLGGDDSNAARQPEEVAAILQGVKPEMLSLCTYLLNRTDPHPINPLALARDVRVLDLVVSSYGSYTEHGPRCSDRQAALALLVRAVVTHVRVADSHAQNDFPRCLKGMSGLRYLRIFIHDPHPYQCHPISSMHESLRDTLVGTFFDEIETLSLVTLCWLDVSWGAKTYRRIVVRPGGEIAHKTFSVDPLAGAFFGALDMAQVKKLYASASALSIVYSAMMFTYLTECGVDTFYGLLAPLIVDLDAAISSLNHGDQVTGVSHTE
jgi:hypothetical protein